MNKERAARITKLMSVTDQTVAIEDFGTLLLLGAAECADMAKEWDVIAKSTKVEDIVRKQLIVEATLDLMMYLDAHSEFYLRPPQAPLSLVDDLDEIEIHQGVSGDNPVSFYTPTPPDDMPHPDGTDNPDPPPLELMPEPDQGE